MSWQIVPDELLDAMSGSDAEKAHKATQAMLQMKKFDLAALRLAMA